MAVIPCGFGAITLTESETIMGAIDALSYTQSFQIFA